MTTQGDDPSSDPVARTSRLGSLPVIGHVLGNPYLRHRDFVTLCSSSIFSRMGMSGEQVIIGILIYEITNSSVWVGIALALYYLPMLVFGLVSGVMADWMDRRVLIRRVELAVFINLIIFAALTALSPGTLWLVITFAVVSASIRDSAYAAKMSYTYDLVGGQNVVAGLSLLNLSTRVGQLVGSLLAGTIVHLYGAPIAILSLAVSSVVAYILLKRLRSAGQRKTLEHVPILHNLKECFSEMRTNTVLFMLIIITGVVEMFGFSFTTVLPELATDQFDVGAEGLGQMHAARAIGGIIAALILTTFVGQDRRGAIFLSVIVAFGAALVLFSTADQFIWALVILVLVAGVASASDVLTQSMMQLSVPDHLRGRAMGIWLFAIGWAPVGHLEMGAIAEAFGVDTALMVNGLALIAVGIIAAIAVPRLRKL